VDNDRTIRLFSYGTLQLASVQIALFGRLLEGSADAMPGYLYSMVEITDPDVIAKSGKTSHPIVTYSGNPEELVEGTVFQVTEAELFAADVYEVADYKRIKVRLRSGIDTWVYVKA
jgi:Gamma-glutamyl cyclotransferase, AIG2-like